MSWFVEWFDTPYYHLLYNNRDAQEAENFIKKIVNRHPLPEKAKVLDLACGKGRHAWEISKFGFDVLGLDLSKKSISYANEHYSNNCLKFCVHDMRYPYFNAPTFHAVFNLFTSFGYFDDQDENLNVLRSVYGQLIDGGYLFFDYLNSAPVIDKLPLHERVQRDGIEFTIHKHFKVNKIIKDIMFEDKGIQFKFQEQVECISFSQMLSWAAIIGFEMVASYGDYELSPYIEDQSGRMIIIFKK